MLELIVLLHTSRTLKWTATNISIAPLLRKLSTLHPSAMDADGDRCPPEYQASTTSTCSSDGNLAPLPWTVQEEITPTTPIHENHIPDAIEPTSPPTIQISPSNSIITPPATSSTSTGQKAHTTPLPCLPPSPVQTLSSSPSPLGNSTNFQALNDTQLVHRGKPRRLESKTMTGMFKVLATALFILPRDGSLVFEVHRGMEVVKQEPLYFETLRKQLWAIRIIVSTINDVLTSLHNEPSLFGSQTDATQIRQDLRSILVEAQASAAVITGFFAQLGQDYSSGSPHSHAS